MTQNPRKYRRKVDDIDIAKGATAINLMYLARINDGLELPYALEAKAVLEAVAEVIEGRVEFTTHQRLKPRPLTIFRHTDGRIWRRAMSEEQFHDEYEEIV